MINITLDKTKLINIYLQIKLVHAKLVFMFRLLFKRIKHQSLILLFLHLEIKRFKIEIPYFLNCLINVKI